MLRVRSVAAATSRSTRKMWRVAGMLCSIAALHSLGALAQKEAIRDSIEVQKARNEHVRSRGKKAFYARKFDLSDLPSYQPEQKITDAIRIWGQAILQTAPSGARLPLRMTRGPLGCSGCSSGMTIS